MPADFDKCVADGGRVRTMPLKGERYLHICYDKNGKSHAGEVRIKGQTKPATEKQG